jgi:hypothetical protein
MCSSISKGDDKFITTDYLQQCQQMPADLVTQASASISETIQVVNSLGGDEHLLSSAKLAFLPHIVWY